MTFPKMLLGAVAVSLGTACAAAAQPIDIGKREFEANCATCHGVTGKGNGPMAGLIDQSLPDLTQIQKQSEGVFPFARLYEVIDGRQAVEWHGSRDMPVWGNEYNEQAPEQLGELYGPGDAEAFVRGRILALIGYIYELQEK